MKAKEYVVLQMAVESGVKYGVRRAYKHTDATEPTDSQVEEIIMQVMNSICEWFDFPHGEEE